MKFERNGELEEWRTALFLSLCCHFNLGRSVETKSTKESAEKVDSTDGSSSDWQEELSSEGYVYYWNTKTGGKWKTGGWK